MKVTITPDQITVDEGFPVGPDGNATAAFIQAMIWVICRVTEAGDEAAAGHLAAQNRQFLDTVPGHLH